jgi:uncharacterized repeat protein (TIGR02543 family)
MKKHFLLFTTMLLISWSAMAQFAGGVGTEGDPYQIVTAEHLNNLLNYTGSFHSDKYFKLMNNIDLTTYLSEGNPGYNEGMFWLPIGNSSNRFEGKLDGNSKKITGFKINRVSLSNIAFFAYLGANGRVENLGIEIDESASVTGGHFVAGLVSFSYGTIINCYVSGTVIGTSRVAGLVGYNSLTISNCYTTGSVSGNGFGLGGLVAYNGSSGIISNSYSRSNITVTDHGSYATYGGFIGGNEAGKVLNCYSTGWLKTPAEVIINGRGFCGTVTTGGNYQMAGNFWDTQTSGATTTLGNATGKTTIQMTAYSTFIDAGWDFLDENDNGTNEIWGLNFDENGGYPFLAWQGFSNNPLFVAGNGSEANPFEISTPNELSNVRYYLGDEYANVYFKVMDNIDLIDYLAVGGEGYVTPGWGTEGWLPIGDNTNRFKGKFDGNNKVINGLFIDRNSNDCQGLFGYIDEGGEIKNFELTNVYVNGYDYVGGVAGIIELATVTNVSVNGEILGNQYIGGIAGSSNSSIESCSSVCDISGGSWYTGGLLGWNETTGTVVKSWSNSTILAQDFAGGLVGKNDGDIEYSYCNGSVSGEPNVNGGVGGFVGVNNTNATIANCYSTSSVNRSAGTDTKVGGFIGYNYQGNVSYSYSTGSVTFEGFDDPTANGFVGGDFEPSVYTSNYFDSESSAQISGIGATAKTTAQMKQKSTFTGWDFNSIWSILESYFISYPYLTENEETPAPGLVQYFAGGEGTSEDPFQIETPEHLNNVRNYLGDAYANTYFVMVNDIDLTQYLIDDPEGWGAAGWLPIGIDNTNSFQGNFDGGDNIISGLKINRSATQFVGLFGYIHQGEVINLGVEIDPTASVIGKNYVGAIAGHIYNGLISNTSAEGLVVGEWEVGLLLGHQSFGVTEHSYSVGEVRALNIAGGFAGALVYDATISNCYSLVNITRISGTQVEFGGFIGSNSSKILNCYSTGWVKFGGTIQTDKGFCGSVNTEGAYEMSNNFWDTETSGATTTAGEATGKTTLQMKQKSTFAGWDFTDTWAIPNAANGTSSYPYLKNNISDPLPGYGLLTFENGEGTIGSPYQITNALELSLVRNYLGNDHADKHFILINDIDLEDFLAEGGAGHDAWGSAGWLPIGNNTNRFRGKFDGAEFKITGLKINRTGTTNIGLFGVLGQNGTIENLGVVIDESASINGGANTGGIVGAIYSGTLSNCNVTGAINGTAYIGGIAGFISIGTLTNCFASTSVSGTGYVGGFVGLQGWDGPCSITNSFATGTVSGNESVGGFAGANDGGSTISNCYSLSNVTRTSGTEINVGGFIGANYSKVLKCYSTGWVKFGETLQTDKGFCGYTSLGSGYQMEDNFWDTQSSGATTTAGEATGKTTSEMKQKSTFTNWDFDAVWSINMAASGSISYPYLTNNTQEPAPGLEMFQFPSGDGSVDDPYHITNALELSLVRQNLDKHFVLMNDIDLADFLAEGGDGYDAWGDAGWMQLGDGYETIFSGSFDGGNHTIANLTINRPDDSWVGLFGKYCPSSPGDSIKNVTLLNVSIVGNSYTGALVAATSQSHIYNCHSTGIVSGPYRVGGLVGTLDFYGWEGSKLGINFGISHSTSSCNIVNNSVNNYTGGIVGYIEGEYDTKKNEKDAPKTRGAKAEPYENAILASCNFTGTVNGYDRSGGVAGYAAYTTISDCQSNITLTSTGSYNGGVIGYAYYCDITNCHSEGTVTAANYSGGVIGYLQNSDISYSTSSVDVDIDDGSDAGGIAAYSMASNISNCSATGNISGYDEIGGIVGNGDGNIEQCSSSGEISGVTMVGGITGAIGGGNINGCTFTGEVTGEEAKIGGIVGMMYSASVSNSSSTGTVSGNNHIGGIAGSTENSQISNCQSTAQITGTTSVGGIVGYYFFTGIENAFDGCTFSGTIEGSNNIGGIAGHMGTVSKSEAKLEVTDCHFTGTIEGTSSMIGGIAGRTEFTNVTDCTNTGTLVGESAHLIGGIVGFFQNGTIDNCQSSGEISGSNFIGGIAGGFNLGPFKLEVKEGSDKSPIYGISNCISSSNINALADDVGGIAGGISVGFIRNSGSTGSIVSQNGNNIGGISGKSVNTSLIEQCFSHSEITGESNVGGIAGYMPDGTISSCYSTGSVSSTANYRAGGIVGKTEAGFVVEYCYSTGIVSSISLSGGIAGDMSSSTIKNSVAINAKVISNGGAGRLICDNDGGNTFLNNYGWDGLYVNDETETGGVLNNQYGLDATIIQLTNEEFYTTPANWDTEAWDFTDTWTINPEVSPYPILKNLDLASQTIQHAQVITWPQVLIGSIDDEIELTAAGGVNAITYTSSNPDVASINENILQIHASGLADITATVAESEFYSPGTLTKRVVIYDGGDGTPENPYEISTLEQLDGVRNNLAAHYKLVEHIDMGSIENWEPIGTQGTPFTGSFDGNEHILSNLNIHGREQLTGLFGCFIPESEEHNYIKDLTLANVNLSAVSHIGALAVETVGGVIQGCNVSGVIKGNGGDYIGGLVGTSLETQFNQCISSVSIDAYSNVRVGGIVAYEDGDGTISYCSFTGSISGDWNTNNVGGIVGETYGSISNCSNTGRIKGAYNVGGIVGYSVGTNTIEGCQNSGNVTGNTIVGGIVGYAQGIIITGCSSSGSITATEMEAGGIAGFSTLSSISLCYNSGKVTSPNDTGGIIGDAQESEIDQCFNTGDVITNSYAGGIIGNIYESTIITNCYSTGEIQASNNNAGGVCGGASESEVSTSYATGKILTQISHGGGIVANVNSSAIKNNFAANALIEDNGDLGRISAETAASTLSNNYAWDDMYVGGVKIIDGTLTDNNGQNAPYAQLSSEAFYTTGGNWDTQPWDFTDVWIMDAEISPYPVLKAMDMDAQKVKHQQGILWDQDITGLNIEDEVPLTAVGGATGSIIYYSSSDPAVASVTEGVLTVHAAGGTMITAWVDGNEFFRPDSVMKSLVIWENEGTEEDPYLIYNLAQLDAVRLDLSAHYKLMDDIDMSPIANWEPIGDESYYFGGNFDGNNFELTNLNIDLPLATFVGLFGYIEVATIKNLAISNINIIGKENVGAIAGIAYDNSIIDNCSSSGSILSNGYEAGGISGGINGNTQIANCNSSCDVTAYYYPGGIVGSATESTLLNCYYLGSLNGAGAGGIAGRLVDNSYVDNCFSAGNYSGNEYIGGICGETSGGNIVNSYSTANVMGTYEKVGGITGYLINASTISNCFSTGYVDGGNDDNSGLVGYLQGSIVANSVAISAKVEGINTTKRVVGNLSSGTLTNNYAWADMYVNDSKVTTGTLTNENGQNATLAQLKSEAFYTTGSNWDGSAWDFTDTWTMNPAISPYPILQNIPAGVQNVQHAQVMTNAWTQALPTDATYGDVIPLTAPSEGPSELIEYTSSNPAVAEIDGNQLTAVGLGTATITVKYPETEFYSESNGFSKTFAVTIKANQTIEWDQTLTATYGDADITLIATATSGLEVAYASDNESVAIVIGSTLTIVGAGTATITASQAGNANYSAAVDVEVTLTVAQRILTLSGFIADSKVYDGTTVVTGTGFSDDRLGSDELLFTYIAAFADKNVGSDKAVNYSDIAISDGADKDNYVLAATSGSANADITVKTLTLSDFTAEDKVYDGTTVVTGTGFNDDRLGSDELLLTYIAAFADKNVGSGKAVNYSDIAISDGADKDNYVLAATIGSTNADITIKTLTLTDFTADNKVYDGTTAVIGTGFSDDRIAGDILAFTYTASFTNKNVGVGKEVSFLLIAISGGADMNNYSLESNVGTTYADITVRTLTLSDFTANSKEYDGTTTVTGTGFSDDRIEDDLLVLTYTAAFDDKNVGVDKNVNYTGIAIVDGSDAGNYSLSATTGTAMANITAVDLTIGGFFIAEDKVFDGTVSATINTDNLTLLTPIFGDDVVISNVVAEFENAMVGQGKIVSIVSVTLDGVDKDNYNLSLEGAPTTTASIIEPTEQFTLTVTIVGNGTVEVDGTAYTLPIIVDEGTVLDLEAIADSGWQFDGWSGDLVSTDVIESVTMDADKALTATFSLIPVPEYTLTIAVVGSGTTTPAIGDHTYTEGTVVNLFASPSLGYEFQKWVIGEEEVLTQSAQVTMTADITATAYFVETSATQFTLTISVQGEGSTIPPVGDNIYNEGAEVNLSAIPATGWQFDGWSGDLVSTEATESITMDADKAITATFIEIPVPQYTLTISIVGNGTVDVEGDAYTVPITVDEGTMLDLEAIADAGWQFDGWSGDLISTDAIESITLNADKAITATFTLIPIPQYTLTISIVGNGSVEVEGDIYTVPITVDEGTVLDLEAIADAGWQFEGWTGDLVSTDSIETINMNADKAITATFSLIPVPEYTLTLAVVGNGTTTPAIGDHTYTEGTVVNLFALPSLGYEFQKWVIGENEVLTQSAQVTMTADIIATAYFVETSATQFTLTISVQGEGSTIPPVGDNIYNEGAMVNLSATPATGWQFDGWSGDLVSTNATESIIMNADNAITATFSLIPIPQYTLTISVVGNGTIDVEGEAYTVPITVDEGTVLDLEAIADAGWQFEGWSGDLVSTDAIETINMNADKSIIATFSEIAPTQYTLTLLVNPVNTGTVTGEGLYEAGEEIDLIATANEGYQFVNWTQGENVVSEVANFIYNMPAENVILTANFNLEQPPAQYFLSWDVAPTANASIYRNEHYSVLISTTGIDADDFTTIFEETLTSDMTNWIYQSREVEITNYSEEEIYIAIRHHDVTDMDRIVIDNVKIVKIDDTYNKSVIFYEDFQGGIAEDIDETWLPEGWQVVDADGDEFNWHFGVRISGDISEGAMRSQSWDANVGALAPDNWLITPSILVEEPVIPSYILTLEVNPSNTGSVMGAGIYEAGEEIDLIATANEGYQFVNWTQGENVVSEVANFTFTMPLADVTLIANFEEVVIATYTLTLEVNPANTGTVTGAGIYEAGEEIDLIATANEGYQFVNWTQGENVVSEVANFTFTMPSADVTLTANIEEVVIPTYTLTLEVNPANSGTVTGAGIYEAGEEIDLTATANEGYQFVNWTQGETVISEVANFTYTMPAENVTLIATFNEIPIPTYTVTFTVTTSSFSAPVSGATIAIEGQENLTTNTEGIASIELEDGAYSYTVMASNFQMVTANFTVNGENMDIPVDLLPLGVEPYILSNVRAYPNPFSHSLTIDNAMGVSRVVVTNLIGQKVIDIELSGAERITLATSELVNGIYLITFYGSNAERVIRKMVKE